eukprot:851657-Prymnesium_polylepis.1
MAGAAGKKHVSLYARCAAAGGVVDSTPRLLTARRQFTGTVTGEDTGPHPTTQAGHCVHSCGWSG